MARRRTDDAGRNGTLAAAGRGWSPSDRSARRTASEWTTSNCSQRAREEGHLVATSEWSGGEYDGPPHWAVETAALETAERIRDGKLSVPHESVVTLFPDSSECSLPKGIYRSSEV